MGQRRGLSEQDLRSIERRCQTHRGRLERSRLVAAWTHNARPLLIAGLTAVIVVRIVGFSLLWLLPVASVGLVVTLWRAWRARIAIILIRRRGSPWP